MNVVIENINIYVRMYTYQSNWKLSSELYFQGARNDKTFLLACKKVKVMLF